VVGLDFRVKTSVKLNTINRLNRVTFNYYILQGEEYVADN